MLCEGGSAGLEAVGQSVSRNWSLRMFKDTDHSCSASTDNDNLFPAIFEQSFVRHDGGVVQWSSGQVVNGSARDEDGTRE